MDTRHAHDLKPGTRVAVYLGTAVGEVYGTPPIITTATVLAKPRGKHVVLGVDFAAGENAEQLPQRYLVAEVLGYLLPLAPSLAERP